MMATVAIDPSIEKTGWAAFGTDGRLLESGVVRTKPDWPLATRLGNLSAAVAGLARAFQDAEGRVRVVVEIPPAFTYARSATGARARNAASMHRLCMATGAIVAAVAWAEVHLVVATVWKGSGQRAMRKRQAQAMAGTRSHDEADAILLGKWFLAGRGGHPTAPGVMDVQHPRRGARGPSRGQRDPGL